MSERDPSSTGREKTRPIVTPEQLRAFRSTYSRLARVVVANGEPADFLDPFEIFLPPVEEMRYLTPWFADIHTEKFGRPVRQKAIILQDLRVPEIAGFASEPTFAEAFIVVEANAGVDYLGWLEIGAAHPVRYIFDRDGCVERAAKPKSNIDMRHERWLSTEEITALGEAVDLMEVKPKSTD